MNASEGKISSFPILCILSWYCDYWKLCSVWMLLLKYEENALGRKEDWRVEIRSRNKAVNLCRTLSSKSLETVLYPLLFGVNISERSNAVCRIIVIINGDVHGLLLFHFVEILHYNLNYFLIHCCENAFNTERLNNPVNTQTPPRWLSVMTLGLSAPHSHTLWCVPTHWGLLMWLRDQHVNIKHIFGSLTNLL